jgi:Family of unknown function (DUF5675)
MIVNMNTGPALNATTGRMVAAALALFTIELPWEDNKRDVSCVPAGAYDLIPYDSPTHGATWRLHNAALNVYGTPFVPSGGRSEIELHSGNWSRQLLGCIALGLESAPMLDPQTGIVEPAVENSRDAVAELITVLGALSTGHVLNINRST